MRAALTRGRRAIACAALAAGTAVACAEFGTGIGDISYIAFDGIPYPALITGDTLRDSLGVATPLRASAFDGSGREIADARFEYLLLDTGTVGVRVDSLGHLIGTTRRDGTVRVIAALDGLQTAARLIRVTRRPDSTFAATAATQTFNYSLPDGNSNVSGDLRISLVSRDTVGVAPGVGGWLVRWRTVHAGDTLAPGDTTLVALQASSGARSVTDTTTAEGTSTRKLRIFAARLTVPVDSFIVLAEVRRHGVPVAGSPVRFVVNIAPPAAP